MTESTDRSTGWIIDDEHSTIDNRYRLQIEDGGDGRTYIWKQASWRDRMTFVCHTLVWPEFTKPSTPLDPFNLVSQGWKYVDSDLRRGEDDVLRVYEESYEKLGQWVDYDSGTEA